MLELKVRGGLVALYSRDGEPVASVRRPYGGSVYVLRRVGSEDTLCVRRFAWSSPEGLDKAMRAAMRKAGWLEEGE